MRVVVTGGAGFIGSHLAERLLQSGHDVISVDSFTPYYSRKIKESNLVEAKKNEKYKFIEADLRTADLQSMLERVDAVFHLGGQPAVGPSFGAEFPTYVEQNILVTHRLLQASRHVKLFVYASSSSVYGSAPPPMREDGPTRPISPYGMTKLAAEQLCLIHAAQGLVPAMAFRFFTVYGPRQRPDMAFTRLCKSILTGTPFPINGVGDQERDFTHVSEVVKMLELALRLGKPGMLLNLGGGQRASLNRAIALIEEHSGKKAILDRRPPAVGDMAITSADTSRLRETFGDIPAIPLNLGLKLQFEWVKEHLALLS